MDTNNMPRQSDEQTNQAPQTAVQSHESLQIMTHRVITMLCRKDIEFLDKLGKDSLFSTGRKLCYSEVLRWLIEFAMGIDMSGDNIDSVIKFKEKMFEKVKTYLAAREPKTHV